MLLSSRIHDARAWGNNLVVRVPVGIIRASPKVARAEWTAVGYQPRSSDGPRLVLAIDQDTFDGLCKGVEWLHVSRWGPRVYLPKRPYLHAGIELKPSLYVAECHHRRLYGGWVLFLLLNQPIGPNRPSEQSGGFTVT